MIGYPLGHSFSARYFAEKFERDGIDAEYRNFEIPCIDRIADIIKDNEALCGLNVTIPYKRDVIPYLDYMSDEAAEIGAVNCIRIVRSEGRVRLEGFNTDEAGFRLSLAPLLQSGVHTDALVLGTGGASGAVMCALRKLGIGATYVSRCRGEGILAYEDLTEELVAENKLIVNCTPVGMFPHTEECPPIPYGGVSAGHLLYDLVYNPERTLFMRRGEERGAAAKNGLEMLHRQADAAWDIWNDNR